MSVSYLDTSALVKRYVDETGSIWLRAQIDPALQPILIVSHLLVAEMTSAFSRRAREGKLSPEEYARLQAAFRGDCSAEYRLVPLNVSAIDLAAGLLERHPLRTLDAPHLATGLLANEFLVGQG